VIKSSAAPSFLGTFALVFVAMGLLYAVDTVLAGMERAEGAAAAARLYREGLDLMHSGKNSDAMERFGDAIALERGNRDYQRALAQAQLAAGKTSDAEATLAALLESDSTDGFASLLMARVLEKEGKVPQAISYLHRAIYGDWNQDQAANQLRARFELIDLLARRNSKDELLAELMAVQDHIPLDLEMKKGRLYLQAGSAAHAAEVFQRVLQEDPGNLEAQIGVGEAEFAKGNYREANRDFETALRLAPDNADARQQLELSNQVLELDPTIRGLGMTERFRRSLKLVRMAADDATECTGHNPPADLAELLDKAATALKGNYNASRQNEASESNLDLAAQIWQARKRECKSAPPPDLPLALVLAKLAQ